MRLAVADALNVTAANRGWPVETTQEAKVPVVGLPETVPKGIKPAWKVILTCLRVQLQWRLNPPGNSTGERQYLTSDPTCESHVKICPIIDSVLTILIYDVNRMTSLRVSVCVCVSFTF